jgi:hypothetical protein
MPARARGKSGTDVAAGLRDAAPSPGSWGRVKDLPLFPVGVGYLDVEADRNRNVIAPR